MNTIEGERSSATRNNSRTREEERNELKEIEMERDEKFEEKEGGQKGRNLKRQRFRNGPEGVGGV